MGLKTEQSLINKESLALENWIIDYATDEYWLLKFMVKPHGCVSTTRLNPLLDLHL